MPATKGEATRERILAAAMELINRKGFHHTSISDILAAAEIKRGNLYFHFASKEKLGLALVAKAKEDYLAYLESSIKSRTPLGQVGDIFLAVHKLHCHRRFRGDVSSAISPWKCAMTTFSLPPRSARSLMNGKAS